MDSILNETSDKRKRKNLLGYKLLDIGSESNHLGGGEDANIYSLCLDKLPSKQEELDDCLKLVSQGTHSLPLL